MLLYVISQLIAVQKKLKHEGELIDSLAKLSQLKEQGGDKAGKSGGGSGGGLKNTLKKMKPAGKKKRQRNVTAPEITAEALKGLRKEQSGKATKDGRSLFGKKTSKTEKEGGSPKKGEQQEEVKDTGIKEEEPLTATEDGVLSDCRFSEFSVASQELPAAVPALSSLSHSKTDPAISHQLQPELSQLSLSSSIPEETGSTQSSLEAVDMEQITSPSVGQLGVGLESPEGPRISQGRASDDEKEEDGEERDFRKGCPELYDDYGDEQHKLNLKHVLKFLEGCNETSPVDLNCLVDWDGWTLASKEVMLALLFLSISVLISMSLSPPPPSHTHKHTTQSSTDKGVSADMRNPHYGRQVLCASSNHFSLYIKSLVIAKQHTPRVAIMIYIVERMKKREREKERKSECWGACDIKESRIRDKYYHWMCSCH